MTPETTSFFAHYRPILKENWQASKGFRILLISTLIWGFLRLIMQFVLLADPMSSQLSVDLQVYLDAAQHFVQRANLYPESLEILEYHFPYPPIFAFLFTPFLWLPKQLTIIVHTLLHILAYGVLFVRWGKIFQGWKMEKASQALISSLPAWFMFSAFWDDLAYLNIYIIMALLGTLLIEAVLKEDLNKSVLWLVLILITKPHWAFAAVLPLFVANYRFFFKLILWALIGYLALAAITFMVGGFDYILGQYHDYIGLLGRLGREFPWRGPDSGFLGYNHSIKQIFAFFLGTTSNVLTFATITKLVLLAPLGFVTVRQILLPIQKKGVAKLLELSFLLYLGAFIWLDIVWEASLTIVIFGYLLSLNLHKIENILIQFLFIPYAVLDAWRLIVYLGGSPMVNDAYLSWDYSMYLPLIMFVILAFYIVLLIRQWPRKELSAQGV